jgi:hypothetical protein
MQKVQPNSEQEKKPEREEAPEELIREILAARRR